MDPTLKLILTFLLGMVSGAILIVLVYLLLMLITIRKRSYVIEAQTKNIEQKEILNIINRYKESYKFASKSDNPIIKQDAFKRNVICLAEEIAKLFFPNSKRPLAELTIDEILMLNRYIVDRIEEIVDRPGLRIIKKLNLNTILDISETKKKIDDSKAMEVVDKYDLKRVGKSILMAINCINPFYWFKKLVVDNVIGLVINKIKLMSISIAGQELYKVYSKRAFTLQNEEVDEQELQDLEKQLPQLEEKKSKKK